MKTRQTRSDAQDRGVRVDKRSVQKEICQGAALEVLFFWECVAEEDAASLHLQRPTVASVNRDLALCG